MSGTLDEEEVRTSTADTVLDKPRAAQRADELTPASRIERFLILDKLGEGGMSTVYAAYDTLLDRRVALKVLRPDRTPTRKTLTRRDVLLREAQAMARLHHPNVVAVLDVGELGEDVYLALELVDGETLSDWLDKRRPWREVVDKFVEAARGLAAAHAVGLVHRDVKPDNMLLGKDGRVRITDFGVASLHHERSDSGDSETSSSAGKDREDDTLSGLRVGTPAYMAPEQFAGTSVDARADQFAFCVSLWEGLFGQRPLGAMKRGMKFADRPFREPPRDSGVPGWLIAAVRRGLAIDVDQRWPSLDALVAELTRDRTRKRRLVIAGALALVLVASIAMALVGWTRGRPAAAQLCTNEDRHLAGVWDEARGTSLMTALRATGAPGADAVATRTHDHLDAWFRLWVRERTNACAATRIHGDQSEATLDLRMRCLDRRLVQVGQVVGELSTLGKDELQRATEITADLPDLSACTDPEQLTAAAPMPTDPVLRGRIAFVEQELAKVAAVEASGRYPAALALATEASAHADATQYLPLRADALAAVGRLRAQTGDHEAGISALRDAASLAASAHADDVTASALVELVWATLDSGHSGEALSLAGAVAPMVTRVHDRGLESMLASEVGDAMTISGDHAGATKQLQHALELAKAVFGPDHVRVAQVLNRLGIVEDHQHHISQARDYYKQALTIVEGKLGPEHPSAAVTRANLCYLDTAEQSYDSAATCYQRVVATLEAALGPDHPQVAWALNDAALVASARGRTDEARAWWERSRDIYLRTTKGQNPDIAWPLVNLAELALDSGQPAQAEAMCKQAVDVTQAADPEGGTMLSPLVCLGDSLAERDPAKAIELCERALHLETAAYESETRGEAHFAIARASLARRDPTRARDEARDALTAYDEAGPTAAKARAKVADWMQHHGFAAGSEPSRP